MTVARSNPLAAGVYWVDVFPIKAPPPAPPGPPPEEDPDQVPIVLGIDDAFTAWAAASPDVVILNRETHDGDPERVFSVFEVRGPRVAPFPFVVLGFPTIQKLQPGVTDRDRQITSDDVVQKPEPGGLGDLLRDELGKVPPIVWVGLAALFLLGGSSKGRR